MIGSSSIEIKGTPLKSVVNLKMALNILLINALLLLTIVEFLNKLDFQWDYIVNYFFVIIMVSC